MWSIRQHRQKSKVSSFQSNVVTSNETNKISVTEFPVVVAKPPRETPRTFEGTVTCLFCSICVFGCWLIHITEELENLLPPLSYSTQTQTTTKTPSVLSSTTSFTSEWVTDYYLHVPEHQMPPVSNSIVYVVIKETDIMKKCEREGEWVNEFCGNTLRFVLMWDGFLLC